MKGMLILLQCVFLAILCDAYRTHWVKKVSVSADHPWPSGCVRWVTHSFFIHILMSLVLIEKHHALRFRETMQCGLIIVAVFAASHLFLRFKKRSEARPAREMKVFWFCMVTSLLLSTTCRPVDHHHFLVSHLGFSVVAGLLLAGFAFVPRMLGLGARRSNRA